MIYKANEESNSSPHFVAHTAAKRRCGLSNWKDMNCGSSSSFSKKNARPFKKRSAAAAAQMMLISYP